MANNYPTSSTLSLTTTSPATSAGCIRFSINLVLNSMQRSILKKLTDLLSIKTKSIRFRKFNCIFRGFNNNPRISSKMYSLLTNTLKIVCSLWEVRRKRTIKSRTIWCSKRKSAIKWEEFFLIGSLICILSSKCSLKLSTWPSWLLINTYVKRLRLNKICN